MAQSLPTASPARRYSGAALITAAMLAFAFQDMVIKILADQVSFWQLQAVRSVIALVMLAALAVVARRLVVLRPGPPGWPLLRAVFMAGAYLLFYASLPVLSLSQAAAAFYMGPLFITLLAAVLLREPIGRDRLAAVAVGFVGVLFVVRPWGEAWRIWTLLPMGASVCYAIAIIITRWRCQDRSGPGLTTVHNFLFTVIGLAGLALVPLLPVGAEARSAMPFLLSGWRPLGAVALVLLLATAASHIVGMLCTIRAYQAEEASHLAPFEYSYLVFVPLLEFAVSSSVPDAATLWGMTLIGCAGVFVAIREGQQEGLMLGAQLQPGEHCNGRRRPPDEGTMGRGYRAEHHLGS